MLAASSSGGMNWRVELAQTESYLLATRSQPSCSNFVKASLIPKIGGRNCIVEREIRAKNKSMTKEERSALESLDQIGQSDKVRVKNLPPPGDTERRGLGSGLFSHRVRRRINRRAAGRETNVLRKREPELIRARVERFVFRG